MPSDVQSAPGSKLMFWAGIVVSALPVLALLASGVMKLLKPAMVVEGFQHLQIDESLAVGLGIVEIACTIIYMIPRTCVLGAILLTGYLGGATASTLRVGDAWAPAVILGVLVWLGLFLRDGRLRELLPLRR